ncbi:LLM class F420-dependent oxidoreductase [Denitratisoma sp. DHT3]|uniref:LLM class F420-dependent oxidoreductase n=1 Tax=Denitratisoma sp. DHT3 TaxID=1981880 RepID=UPI001198811E|nr:LLM class F420-dependent oxidoreductase [Denitratisoma sp. DHT3]QDX82165.1 LLM class F420-dependent oxidoreductase [Denitratisoma sp. DHT3]
MKLSIGLFGLQNWFSGDFSSVVDVIRIADRKGADQVSLTDHVVMGEQVDRYPYGAFPAPLDTPWYEPITVLAAIAGATERIRLSTGILISPLRPAVLLAKQLATLDVMSRGRVEIGIGTGWQREEYEAAGIDFEKRYRIMDEQVRVCRALWSEAPVSFQGETVQLERIHQWPRPVQPRLPIWLGIAPTPRNCQRMAELADGWIPMLQAPKALATGLADIRAAFDARGRDFAGFQTRVVLPGVFRADGTPDLAATLAQIPALRAAGVTMVEILPLIFCRGPDDMESFLDQALDAVKG